MEGNTNVSARDNSRENEKAGNPARERRKK